MMKKFKKPLLSVVSTAVAVASLFSLAACATPAEPLTDKPLEATKIADYTKTAEERKETFASGSKGFSWENGDPFNVWWKPQNVSYEGGKMSLSLSEMTVKEQKWDAEKEENVDVDAEYYGAEERSEHYYGYGDFKVRMKPAKVVGTASTFFTCTGPYDKWYDEDGVTVIKENQHDEIDIEFLGNDTTKVQFNYYTNGVGGHEHMHNLGFDASLEYHDYGYRWTENYITWFVDGTPVYRVDRKGEEAWPSHPGRIIMNYWCGTDNAAAWMGEFAEDYSGKAEYEYVATSATQCPDPNTAHIRDEPVTPPDGTEVPTEGWTAISTDAFDGWGMYDVDKENGLTISHEEAKTGWSCCGMPLADCYDWVKMTLTNNKETAATVRLSIKDTALADTVPGAIAGVITEGDATYDSGAGVAVIKLNAKEAVDVVLKMKAEYANQLTVFLNSTDNADAASGSVTITGLQGIVNGEIEQPEPPEPPEGDNCALNFSSTEVYTVDNSGVAAAEITVTYTEAVGATYKNIAAQVANLAADNDTFSLKIKNNGEAAVKLRIDLIGENKITVGDNANMECCNLSSTATGGSDSYTDTTWGGTMITVAADEEAVLIITYSNTSGIGAVQRVQIYLDTSTYGDENTYSGNVTFGEFKFYTAESGTEE